MITIVSMSRRPEAYRTFVQSTEKLLDDLISNYLVFVNKTNLIPFYKNLENNNDKIKVFTAPENFVMIHGHDTVYNFLDNKCQTPYILKLFDSDEIEIDKNILIEELSKNLDIYGIPTYMERGNVWENKYQLYKKNILTWYGLVHENQHFLISNPSNNILKGLKVYHKNAIDKESMELEKTSDEKFLILKETKEGTDSDERNLLYETLTWKIVNENGRHDNPEWFKEHYKINKKLIDYYYNRAQKIIKG